MEKSRSMCRMMDCSLKELCVLNKLDLEMIGYTAPAFS